MWIKTTLAAALLLLAGSLLAAKTRGQKPLPPTPDPDCKTCSDHGEAVGVLTRAEFRVLLAQFAAVPVGCESDALDALLFHGARTRTLVAQSHGLAASHRAYLERELSRDHARLSVRVVAEDGTERIRLDRRVPLDIKQHLHGTTRGLQNPEISGTVRRVGLDYVWGRL